MASDSIFAFNNEDFSDRKLRFVEIYDAHNENQKEQLKKQQKEKITEELQIPIMDTSCDTTNILIGTKRKRPPSPDISVKLQKIVNDDTKIGANDCILSELTPRTEVDDTLGLKEAKTSIWNDGVEECLVSRALLATRSNYFKKLFSTPFLEKGQSTIQIDVEPGEASLCMELLKFIYSGCPDIFPDRVSSNVFSMEQLMRLLLLADRFDIPLAVAAIANTITGMAITPKQCEQLLRLPVSLLSSIPISPLIHKINDTLQSKFGDFDSMFCTKQFVRLSEKAIISIISNDNLKLRSENTIWQALEFWAKLPVDNPRGYKKAFTEHIRFPIMDALYLRNVVMASQVYKNFPCVQKAVTEALSFHAVKNFPSLQQQMARNDDNTFKKVFRKHRAAPGSKSNVLQLSVPKEAVMRADRASANTKINDIIIQHKRIFVHGYSLLGVLYRMVSKEKRDMIVLYLRCEGIPDMQRLYLPLKCRLGVGTLQSPSNFILEGKHPVQLVSLVDFSQLNDHQPYFVDGKFQVSVEFQFPN